MIRIAFACNNKNGLDANIAKHFGRCKYFIIVDLVEGEVKNCSAIENPYFNNHESGLIPDFIKSKSVNVVISGGIGKKALEKFEKYEIKAKAGLIGKVSGALDLYNQNKLFDFSVSSKNDSDFCQ